MLKYLLLKISRVKKGGGGVNTQIPGIVSQKGATLCNQTPPSGNLGRENGRNSCPSSLFDISQGLLTASSHGSLTAADGKTKTIKGWEGKVGSVEYEFLQDLVVACGLKQ